MDISWYIETWYILSPHYQGEVQRSHIVAGGLSEARRRPLRRKTLCGDCDIPSGNQSWLAGKSSMNGGFNRKRTYKCFIFYCHVWLPEGISGWYLDNICGMVQGEHYPRNIIPTLYIWWYLWDNLGRVCIYIYIYIYTYIYIYIYIYI